MVAKGSLFATMQSVAMGGIGASSTVAGVTVGGAVGAAYLRDFCTFVDQTDPESKMGVVFATSARVVTTAIEAKEKVQSRCASSATCTDAVETMSAAGTSAVETVSSLWDSFSTGVSYAANYSYPHVFDYIRKSGLIWDNTSSC